MRKINLEVIETYKTYLTEEEKSSATIEKYVRDVMSFYLWCYDCEICKKLCLEYKTELMEHYAERSVNSIISSLNSFFDFMNWQIVKLASN